MALNLRKGSKVSFFLRDKPLQGKKRRSLVRKGIVISKFTARKGSMDFGRRKESRTIVEVMSSRQTFIKRPSELRRIKKRKKR